MPTLVFAENGVLLVRAFESDNATLIWSVPGRASGARLDILRIPDKYIVTFLFGFASHHDPRVVPSGDGNATFGVTFPNVTVADAGEYRCLSEANPCGRIILFIWGELMLCSMHGNIY